MNSELLIEVHTQKRLLKNARLNFLNILGQTDIFSAGTYERISEIRLAEQDALFKKLDAVKRSIPSRLLKKIEMTCNSYAAADELTQAIASLVTQSTFYAEGSAPYEMLTQLNYAKRRCVYAYHDLAKHLLLQTPMRDSLNELSAPVPLINNLAAYTNDIFAEEKCKAVLADIAALEKQQRYDSYKRYIGLTLRAIGWGIMIVATLATLSPTVSLMIVGISIAVTMVGQLIDLLGKAIGKPRIAKEQLPPVVAALSFFKKAPTKADPKPTASAQITPIPAPG